jgi:aspartyl-tRNA(Asn)/glutamyl-tRNA(Gln) amidotransferase subunit B
VIEEHPEEVASFQDGKESLMGWFVGQVMRASRGKADAKAAKEILNDLLGK